jgi:hypothetical protein
VGWKDNVSLRWIDNSLSALLESCLELERRKMVRVSRYESEGHTHKGDDIGRFSCELVSELLVVRY